MVDPAYRVEQVFIILVTSTLFILHVAVIIATYYDINRALFYRHYMQRLGCIASFLLLLLSIDPYGINGIYPPSFTWFLANLATTIVFSSAAGYFYLLCDTHYRNLQHPSPPLRIFKRFLYCLMCGMLIMSIIPMVINLITHGEAAQALFLLYTTMVSFAYFVTLNIQSNRLVYALDCYLESILPPVNVPVLQVSNPVPGPRPSYLHRSGIQHATNMSHMVRHVSFANHSSYDIQRKSTYLPQQSSSSTYSSAQPSSSQQTTPRGAVDHDLMEHTIELTKIITKLRIFQIFGSIILLSTAMINAVVSMENLVNGRSFQSDPNNFNGLRNWYVWELCAALTVGLYVAWVPLRCKPLPESYFYGRNRTNTHRPYNEHVDGKKQHMKLNLNQHDHNESHSVAIPLPTITQDFSSMNKEERKTTVSLTVNPVYEERPSIYTAIHTATSSNMHHQHDPTQTPSQKTYTPSQMTALPPRPSPLQLTSTLPSRPSSPSVHVRPSIRLSSPRLPPLHMSPIPLPHALPSQAHDGEIPAPA